MSRELALLLLVRPRGAHPLVRSVCAVTNPLEEHDNNKRGNRTLTGQAERQGHEVSYHYWQGPRNSANRRSGRPEVNVEAWVGRSAHPSMGVGVLTSRDASTAILHKRHSVPVPISLLWCPISECRDILRCDPKTLSHSDTEA